MSSLAGGLGDTHDLSARAREYANTVIFDDVWPLTADHVTLDAVTFETSTRMKRKHGLCIPQRDNSCIVRLSEKTSRRAGLDAIQETIRHELVHVYQHQTDGVDLGHGNSFEQWVGPLELAGRCSNHYEEGPSDYNYSFHCPNCGFIGGRYRLCKTVRAAVSGTLYCSRCNSENIAVRDTKGAILTAIDDP